ncbi:hypothetical protein GF314_06820 [bacterium]|jgi:hypothetical protein|nr:hypothetical protein [bacterium]
MMHNLDQHTPDRANHFDRLQRALEEGLQAINAARSPEEAERARMRARRRLEELNRDFESTFAGR